MITARLGCVISHSLSENDSTCILSGNDCPKDYKTITIICVTKVIAVPQDTTFFVKGFGKIFIKADASKKVLLRILKKLGNIGINDKFHV